MRRVAEQQSFDILGRVVLLSGALALAVAGCGGDSSGPGGGGSDREPTPTAAGTPFDVPASLTIGPEGGTVQHPSGALRIVVPAGAVSSPTDFSIQPISAEAPGAVSAFRLGPAGVQFAVPVSLTFSYDDAQMNGSAPEVSWIAVQEGDGAWRYADNVVLDTGARTLTVQTTHFTDWTLLHGLQLRPPAAEVDPGGSVELEVKNCLTQLDGVIYGYECVTFDFGDEDDLPSLPSRDNPQGSVDGSSWAVNGDVGGSGIYGLVFGSDSPGTLGTAEFRAPTETPEDRNPVAVTVDIRDRSNRRVATLVSNVRITGDLPTIHVVGEVDKTNEGIANLVSADIHDRVEFDVAIEPDGGLTISNWQNFPSSYTNPRMPPGSSGFCRYTIDGPYEFGTYTTFSGGATSLDEFMITFSGAGTIAASTYYVPDQDGACSLALPFGPLPFNNIGSHILFEPARFDRVGAVVVVLGTDTDGVTLDGWAFQMTRTR